MIATAKPTNRGAPTPTTGEIRAATYIRMSSDAQEASPDQQRTALKQLAERYGLAYVREYGDEGISGIERAKRASFTQMLADAQRGDFQVIAAWDQDRFSRLDSIDSGEIIAPLRRKGVRLITVAQGEIDWTTFAGRLVFNVQQEGKNQYLQDLSRNVVRGRIAAAKAGRKLGRIPYAFDRLILDERGQTVRQIHFRAKFKTPKGWSYRLVPSADAAAVEALRWMFRATAFEGLNTQQIAQQLNQRKAPAPRGAKFWHWQTVRRLLRNAAYVGDCINGEKSCGKFHTLGGPIVVENAHEPLVDRKTFDKVQTLTGRGKQRRQRATDYILTGILHCGHCGARMHGHTYKCRSYDCRLNPENLAGASHGLGVNADNLEQFLIRTVVERALSAESIQQIRERVAAKLKQRQTGGADSGRIKRKIRDLQADIDGAMINLARAKGDDFAGIAAVIATWRAEIKARQADLDRADGAAENGETSAEAVMAGLHRLRTDAGSASPAKVRAALAQIIERVTLRREQKRTRRTTGEITFQERLGLAPIAFDQSDYHPTTGDEAARVVRGVYRGEPVSVAEYMRAAGILDRKKASYHLKNATRLGLLENAELGQYRPVAILRA